MSDDVRSGPDPQDDALRLRRRSLIVRDCLLVALLGLPTLVWYGLWRFAGTSLVTAAAAALLTGMLAVLAAVPIKRVRAQLLGLALLAVSVSAAALTGEARDYFVPGILVDSAYAAVLFGSALVRRPLIGVVLKAVAGRWLFRPPGSARAHMLLTLLWATRFLVEAAVMTVLYVHGDVDLLLAVRLAMRAPLQIVCAAITVAVLTRDALRTGRTARESR
ncbi:DUF3159 domain-containing protein [Streptomyces sp. AK02-01A]|uniref:DUF3159 domain-containing protein n=1 Tax=Streptomyces sp. AK02-01A TaxID=3028648 RepID=UPI0029ADC82E|nr:DUF3159 domain-containing protein [Streptomyces sp. AK02-01A]MDX3854749.1 DUF3159 domain-containing protein [Streptomyces sp. AK02-01A]